MVSDDENEDDNEDVEDEQEQEQEQEEIKMPEIAGCIADDIPSSTSISV